MEPLLLAVAGAIASIVVGITGRAVEWCWEWLKRRRYTSRLRSGTRT